MMCVMVDTNTSENGARDGGVLANLPRTRPQRTSARRSAARGAAVTPSRSRKQGPGMRAATKARTAVAAAPARPAAAPKRDSAPRRPTPRRTRPPAPDEAAPRQGFECDSEASGGSVAPPGGAELVATAAEIVGELAKAGLSTGERLFKDVLSRLPLS
jgi:hypothetical protein